MRDRRPIAAVSHFDAPNDDVLRSRKPALTGDHDAVGGKLHSDVFASNHRPSQEDRIAARGSRDRLGCGLRLRLDSRKATARSSDTAQIKWRTGITRIVSMFPARLKAGRKPDASGYHSRLRPRHLSDRTAMTPAEEYRVLKERAVIGAVAPRSPIARPRQRPRELSAWPADQRHSRPCPWNRVLRGVADATRTDAHRHARLRSGDMILLDVPAELATATLQRLDQSLFTEDVQTLRSLAIRWSRYGFTVLLPRRWCRKRSAGAPTLDAWTEYQNSPVRIWRGDPRAGARQSAGCSGVRAIRATGARDERQACPGSLLAFPRQIRSCWKRLVSRPDIRSSAWT